MRSPHTSSHALLVQRRFRSMRWRRGLTMAVLLLLAFGCTRLESKDDRFEFVDAQVNVLEPGTTGTASTSATSSEPMGCTDPEGFEGAGCYRCEPTDILTLQNACTDSTCTRFDNAVHLTKLDASGALPSLPSSQVSAAPSAAATSPAATGAVPSASGTQAPPTASASAAASATPSGTFACADLAQQGTVVYVTGSSAAKPFLQQIAQQLSVSGVYLVYESTGSCVGVDAILNGTPMTSGPPPAPAASATYWDGPTSSGAPCDLPEAGVLADLGVSDVFAGSCPGFELLDLEALNVVDAHGPIQTMTFAVPANSEYTEISAQAAYFVYGFGASAGIKDAAGNPMWDDETAILQRSGSSGTQAMIAAAIGVPSGAWKGKTHKTSDDVAAALQSAGATREQASKTIGILAADYIDSKNLRAQVRSLAYQDSAQTCAFYPDSSSKARDKRNVRDGHYPIWGPLHLMYKVTEKGVPLNSEARQSILDIVGYLSGTKALPNGVKLIEVYAQSGLIPECAMRVTRSKDGGNIVPYSPPAPCSCLFDAQVGGTAACVQCLVQADCKSGHTCSQGYCEPQ